MNRSGHFRAADLYERALAGVYPAGIERHTPAAARLIHRGRVAMAIEKARVARERAIQFKGLPIGDDCQRWLEREIQTIRNARRDHSYYVGISAALTAPAVSQIAAE